MVNGRSARQLFPGLGRLTLAIALILGAAPGPASAQAAALPIRVSLARAGQGEVTQLDPVPVEATRADDLPPVYAGGQVASGARLGLLGNVAVQDAPFSQTSYTSALIENQQAVTLGDVLDNMPSVRRSVPAYNIGEQFKIRGFGLSDSQTAIDGLYGLMPAYGGTPPLEIAERVDVLLGPSALLNGMAPVGGSLNLVPKRAADAPLARLTLGMASASQAQAHADVGRRLGADGAWGLRVNGSRHDGGTTLKGLSRQDGVGALALDYRGHRLRAALDLWRSSVANRGGTPMIPGIDPSVSAMPRAPDGGARVSDDDYDANNTTAMLGAEFDLAHDWTVYAKVGARHNDFAGQGQLVTNVKANGEAYLFLFNTRADNHARSAELGVRGRFQTGALKHVLGVSGVRQEDETRQGFVYARPNRTNIYAPPSVRNLPAAAGEPPKTSASALGSVALADTLSLADERVRLTLGARRQRIKVDNISATLAGFTPVTSTYDQYAWTPMAALVLKPIEPLALYVNAIEGLEPGVTVGGNYQNAGEVLPPYKTRQIEAGAKLESGGLTHTLSVFQIKRPSAQADTGTAPLPTLRRQGQQRNRGIEWSLFGEWTPRVRVLGGISYLQGKLIRTAGGAHDGNDAPGTAPLAANLGVEWDVPGLAGLSLSGRVLHTRSQYLDDANTITLPSWTRLDLGARYAARIAGKAVTLRASVRNVADKRYWEGVYMSGYVSPAAPRTVLLSATVDF